MIINKKHTSIHRNKLLRFKTWTLYIGFKAFVYEGKYIFLFFCYKVFPLSKASSVSQLKLKAAIILDAFIPAGISLESFLSYTRFPSECNRIESSKPSIKIHFQHSYFKLLLFYQLKSVNLEKERRIRLKNV